MSALLGETNEDLHLRMDELQKKLKDSEEERKMLEKTCDILIKAFRDEQRIYYNALNSKYEKFLEDYSIRRRRNDIIMRSLCRVEDRAKVIYSKTEKLKLLKDRYISYLKQNEFLKDEESRRHNALQNTIIKEEKSKSVHWKMPLVAEEQVSNLVASDILIQEQPSCRENAGLTNGSLKGSRSSSINDNQEESPFDGRDGDQNLGRMATDNMRLNFSRTPGIISEDMLQYGQKTWSTTPLNMTILSDDTNLRKNPPKSIIKTYSDAHRTSMTQIKYHLPLSRQSGIADSTNKESDSLKSNHSNLKMDSTDMETVKVLRERGLLKPQESIEKLKLTTENYDESKKQYEDDFDSQFKSSNHESEGKLEKASINGETIDIGEDTECRDSRPKQLVPPTKSRPDIFADKSHELQNNGDADHVPEEEVKKGDKEKEEKEQKRIRGIYPKGLDGVDYQNETYPESYYEQPVRSDKHSSLISKVILEEDEYELDAETRDPPFQGDQTSRGVVTRESFSDKENGLQIHSPSFRANISTTLELSGRRTEDINGGSSSGVSGGGGVEIPLECTEEVRYFPLHDNQTVIDKGDKAESGDKRNLAEESADWLTRNPPIDPIGGDDDSISEESVKLNSQTDDDDDAKSDKFKKIRDSKNGKSNLIRLLESDSESYQLEHGEIVSGNDDSDFDFSFNN